MSRIPTAPCALSYEEQLGTVIIKGSAHSINMRAVFSTVEERDAVLALLPKSYGARAGHVSGWRDSSGALVTLPTLHVEAKFSADAVNGGLNESGAIRLAKATKKLLAARVPMAHQLVGRDCLSAEDVEKVLFPV